MGDKGSKGPAGDDNTVTGAKGVIGDKGIVGLPGNLFLVQKVNFFVTFTILSIQ